MKTKSLFSQRAVEYKLYSRCMHGIDYQIICLENSYQINFLLNISLYQTSKVQISMPGGL